MKRSSAGQSLIELLIAMAMSAIILPALLTGMVSSREGKQQQKDRINAEIYAIEAFEAVRTVRERDWNEISLNGTYHPEISGNTWILSPGAESFDGFTRSIEISSVGRDAGGKITESGGTVDASMKKITVSVSWGGIFPSSITQSQLLSRYLHNGIYTETTQAQFQQGLGNKVEITNTQGGEVILGAGGWGNWCKPELALTSLDLPKNGVANAISAIEGRVFAATGDNASGVSYATVDIDNYKPPHATVSATFDGYKTNGIYGERDYAYLATDTNGKQGVIIDLTSFNPVTKKYSEIGSLNAGSGSVKAKSIFVSSNIAYLSSTDNKINAYDISVKTGSHNPIASVSTTSVANKIIAKNGNLYAAIDSNSTQLQIIPLLSNGRSFGTPLNISVAGQYGRDLWVKDDGTRVYLATSSSANQNEFFIIDSDPLSGNYRNVVGSYDTSGMDPRGVTKVTEEKAIIVGTGGIEYQVINVSTESALLSCGNGLNVDTGIFGVSSLKESDGDAYSYIITGDATTELKIIEGGPGGQYALSGEYTSIASDSGRTVAFNRIRATAALPDPSTSIRMQVATADAVSGSCTAADYIFVGPSGTASDFYLPDAQGIIQGPIPLNDDGIGYENPGRCLKYLMYLSTSDKDKTQVLYDVKFNMSP